MKTFRQYILLDIMLFVWLVLPSGVYSQSYQTQVSSPNAINEICFILDTAGNAFYTVQHKGDTLLGASRLGIVLQNDSLNTFDFITKSEKQVSENWSPVWGISSSVQNNYNSITVNLRKKNGKSRVNVEFRCFDDGIAFRYILTGGSKGSVVVIMSEDTRFNLYGTWESWWSYADYNTLEKEYYHTAADSAQHVATPFTLKNQNGKYICIHEAAITEYTTMTLRQDSNLNNAYQVNLVPWADGTAVKTRAPVNSPWRVVFIADTAGDLLVSNLLYNLNDECIINDVSWIQPMVYNGIWWEMHLGISTWDKGPKHGATTVNALRYIDFSAENQWGGCLIEGWNTGWENWGKPEAFDFVTPYSDFDLRKVAEYAAAKNVVLIGHHETGGDIVSYEYALDSAFSLYQSMGIRAVKTGYAGAIVPAGEYHHGQYMVEHCNMVMRKAAQYHLMLDVHEPVIMSGLSRTYPNLMTSEGVRGMEWNAWSKGNMPRHTCILPFTRGMAGPVDYTAGIFDIDLSAHRDKRVKWNSLDPGNTAVHSTIANQLALMLVLYSPMQMAADLPENYKDHPALDLLRQLPTTFDETRVPDAEIGEYIIITRRKGEIWYLAAITNEKSREFEIALNFLNENTHYQVDIYEDGETADYRYNPEAITVKKQFVGKTDVLKFRLASGGGYIAVFRIID